MTHYGPPDPLSPPPGPGYGGAPGYGGGPGYGGPGYGGPGVAAKPAFPLWPIIVVTFFFSLFGLIPTIIASNRAGERRESSSRYWLAFVFSLIGAFVFYVVLTLVLVLVVFAGTVAVVGGAVAALPDPTSPSTSGFSPTASRTASGATTGPCGYTPVPAGTNPNLTDVPLPEDPDPTPTATRTWTLTTSAGTVVAELDAAAAPCTVQSMVHLTGLGFFDGTTCPRSVDSGIFVLQCGDPSGTTAGGPSYTFGDEDLANAQYTAGTLAMANGGPDTNGSQFFIVTDASQLAPNYTVFGRITQGLDIVQAIVAAGNDGSNQAGGGVPNTPVTITSATVS